MSNQTPNINEEYLQEHRQQLGLRIYAKRVAMGYTREDLADQTGISLNTVYRIEKGQLDPKISLIQRIAVILKLDLHLDNK